jgi:large subunit ribosomal protein L28
MITGKGVQSGNNVSHSQTRTRRRFLPNVHSTSVYSEVLGRKVRLRISTEGLRTLDHKGGLDAFLLNTSTSKLDPSLHSVKRSIEKVQARQKAS